MWQSISPGRSVCLGLQYTLTEESSCGMLDVGPTALILPSSTRTYPSSMVYSPVKTRASRITKEVMLGIWLVVQDLQLAEERVSSLYVPTCSVSRASAKGQRVRPAAT